MKPSFRTTVIFLVFFSIILVGCSAGGMNAPQPPAGGGIPAVQLSPTPEIPNVSKTVELPEIPNMPDAAEMAEPSTDLPAMPDMPDFSTELGEIQSTTESLQTESLNMQSTAANIADLASQITQFETNEDILALATQMSNLALQIEQDATQQGIVSDEINYRIDNSEQTTLALSDDILEMANKIGEMADRILWTELQIGKMGDRIVESEYLISDSTLALVEQIQESLKTIDTSAEESKTSSNTTGTLALNIGMGVTTANAPAEQNVNQAVELARSAYCCAKMDLLAVQLLTQQALRMQSAETDLDALTALNQIVAVQDEAERDAAQQERILSDLTSALEAEETTEAADLLVRAQDLNKRLDRANGEVDELISGLVANENLSDEFELLPAMQDSLATSEEMVNCIKSKLETLAMTAQK